MNTIKEQKKILRNDIKQQLKNLPPADSRSFYEGIGHFKAYQNARTVLLYASLPEEAPTRKLIDLCLADNKITALPRVAGKDMDFFILDPDLPLCAQTQKGVFGITEPNPCLPLLSPEKAETPILIFVPGLAFDKSGSRLGRGGGYYDRYLAGLCSRLFPAKNGGTAKSGIIQDKTVTLVGLCRSIQIVEKVPAEAHDIRVDFLMSEKRIEKTERKSGKIKSADG